MSTHQQIPHLKRYEYLDSLRGIAILLVLIAHTHLYGQSTLPGWFASITSIDFAPRGVQLFYLVSAFTLCLSFSKRKNKEHRPIRNFYIRRFFRIAPLFYLALFYYIVQAYFFEHKSYSFANILTTVMFINGAFPAWMNNIVIGGWSIAVETSFYLIFPVLFYFLKNIRWAFVLMVVGMIGMQLFRLFLLGLPLVQATPDLQTYTFEFFPSQLPIFLIGITVFVLAHTSLSKQDKRFLQWGILLMGLLLGLQTFFGFKLIAGHYIYSLFFAGVLFFLSRVSFVPIVNTVTAFLGKISFSLYLCHVAVLFWLDKLHVLDIIPSHQIANFAIRFILLFVVSTTIASVLYFLVEKTGIALGKRIIDHFEHTQTAVV
jgi:peptidoglycan/LPS O-acetylase OafA/YrhL